MPRRTRSQRNLALLERLSNANVEFCIIGGVAAVLHGATRMTLQRLGPTSSSTVLSAEYGLDRGPQKERT